MKQLLLVRESPTATEIRGRLTVGSKVLYTIERPWIPTAPGGKPRESCVPAGTYRLCSHTRPNGDGVFALVNPGLGVYYLDEDRPSSVGRFLILIHAGNWVTDVVGCIAPGTGRGVNNRGPMVTGSRDAMEIITNYIDDDDDTVIIIRGDNTVE